MFRFPDEEGSGGKVNLPQTTTSSIPIEFETGNVAFILMCTALVWLMIPGLGFFYAGMLRVQSALNIMIVTLWSATIVAIQWFAFGYSLAFSKSDGWFIGNFDHIFLRNVYTDRSIGSDQIPAILFCVYQGMFACITPALALGAGAERTRFLPTGIFTFIWTSLVYDFLAFWTWNPSGWSNSLGGLDFAGGTPIHISSGAAGLALAIILGPRHKCFEEVKPHNLSYTVLGTALLWFGWFGFNGGSALTANIQAVNAVLVTNLSASSGGLTWIILDRFADRKWSPLGFCSGAVAGLVCITPAAGFVSPASSFVFGIAGAILCNCAVRILHLFRFDDPVDIFGVHGVGGIFGGILTGVFAQKFYAPGIEGGWLDGHYMQILHQLVDCLAAFGWSFGISFIVLGVMNFIPPLRLRLPPEVERTGLDISEMKSSCYQFHTDLRDDISNQIQFGQIWHRFGDTSGLMCNRNQEGRKFDYVSQQKRVDHFCKCAQ